MCAIMEKLRVSSVAMRKSDGGCSAQPANEGNGKFRVGWGKGKETGEEPLSEQEQSTLERKTEGDERFGIADVRGGIMLAA